MEGALLGELPMRVFFGAPPTHAAAPAPGPRFWAVEAQMLMEAAARLCTGCDRLRFDWGAC